MPATPENTITPRREIKNYQIKSLINLRYTALLQHGWKYAMAQQTTVRFIDDLDGSDAVGTVGDLLAGKPLL